MPIKSHSFCVGRVRSYLRGRIWYLCYHENGRRRRPRVGSDATAARKLAAQINAQLETGARTALSFEPITVEELRQRWLEHHEHVLRSSVHTVRRYHAATDHLLRFAQENKSPRLASGFAARDAEQFVRYLRRIEVAPNGHKNSRKRHLLDKGIQYILESCRAMFTYAAKRRHLSPYAENPLTAIEIDRIPIENAKPILLLTPDQERQFLETCDAWQLPLFATLLLTGLRPGELAHLLLPEDLDLAGGWIRVRNKLKLGWQVKTRSERDVPVLPELMQVLSVHLGQRRSGPVFLRREACSNGLEGRAEMEAELAQRIAERERRLGRALDRAEREDVAKSLWWAMGAVREDRIRMEFIRVVRRIGLPLLTMPKVLRHQFATALQDANMDPLIRNQLMGHMPTGFSRPGGGLGMTAVYTHSRPETVRRQLELALQNRPALEAVREWLRKRAPTDAA